MIGCGGAGCADAFIQYSRQEDELMGRLSGALQVESVVFL